MKSIVRRDTGEDWKEYVTRLMHEEDAIRADEEPTDEELRRFDKRRKNKRVSNDEWVSTTDPESRITRMKDGTSASGIQGRARGGSGERIRAGSDGA